MADNYLNETGLGYYHSRIKTLFAKQADVNALTEQVEELITEGGEPNVIEVVKVNGTQLTPDATKAVNVETLTMDDYHISDTAGNGIAFGLSDDVLLVNFYNDGSLEQEGEIATVGYVDEYSGKIDAIEVNGIEQPITNKQVNLIVPTTTNDLTNNSDFQTSTEVQALIDASIAEITGIDFQVVQTLPATGEHGVIYLVGNAAPYDEYIWITPTGGTAHFEQIGATDIDLSDYWAKTDLVAITTAEIDALFA